MQERRIVESEGWTLQVSKDLDASLPGELATALELMANQLREINAKVPASSVTELKKVTLWLSADYSGIAPTAEYHPSAGWLKANGRDPLMEKGVEFTNIRVFESETKRMPIFVLHELAHAFHDQVLTGGWGNTEIEAAYQKAKASGSYDAVEQRDGKGGSITTKAYAMTNAMEYFAESTESYFSTNDICPFKLDQLLTHDATMATLVPKLWGVK